MTRPRLPPCPLVPPVAPLPLLAVAWAVLLLPLAVAAAWVVVVVAAAAACPHQGATLHLT